MSSAATSTENINNLPATETLSLPSDQTGGNSNSTIQIIETENLPTDNTAKTAKIMAMWAMTENGSDDSSDAFAQFMPPLTFAINKNYQICAVVDAADNLSGVYNQIFYPLTTAFASNDSKNRVGCGEAAAPHCAMNKLVWKQGYDLFCGQIQSNNNNLPLFAKMSAAFLITIISLRRQRRADERQCRCLLL